MKLRDGAPLVLIFVLGGCSGADLNDAFAYAGIGGKDQQASPPSDQPDASAGVVATSLPLPEDAAATRPWTPVGATPLPARTIVAEPVSPRRAPVAAAVSPPPTVAAAPVPPRRATAAAPVSHRRTAAIAPVPLPPTEAAPVPPPPTVAAPVSHRRSTAIASVPPPTAATAPRRRPVIAAAPPVFAPPVVAATTRSEPPPAVVAPAPPQTVVAAAAPPVAEPPPVAPAPDSWCSRVAESTRADAASQGFDAATQRHRAEVSYNQCVRYGH